MLIRGPLAIVITLLLGASLVIWGFAPSTQGKVEASTEMIPTDRQFPVLAELFTSQGCSSCPPADRVLQSLATEAAEGQLPVVTLSYHVDYWNRLGWKDPYSQATFSERQRAYANNINDRGVYTPQLVINGRSGHIGSREREVRTAVQAASRRAPVVEIQHGLHWSADGKALTVDYQLSRLPDDAVLQIAIIEKQLENDVPRGENRGRHLTHTNVVRQLVSLTDLQKEGRATVELSESLTGGEGAELGIVVFLQDGRSMEVLGTSLYASQLSR